jgi:hypothetical protein
VESSFRPRVLCVVCCAGAARHFSTFNYFFAPWDPGGYKAAISLEKYKAVIKFLMAATAGCQWCQGTKNRVFASESAQSHHARTRAFVLRPPVID